MSYCGYITTLKNVRPHPNADRMKLADCFGNTVCVGLDAAEGEIVLYFPTDGQLSEEYCAHNNLVRRKDENGNNVGGYLDPEKRNIRTLKLRGEKSDGLAISIFSLEYTGINFDKLNVGDTITTVNGHEICQKYIPARPKAPTVAGGAGKHAKRRAKHSIAPTFYEHVDTEQLAYNLAAFKPGDEIEITLKMHGTSQRTANLPVLTGYKRTFWDKILRRPGAPIYEYGGVSGTRRVVLDSYDGGFYGSNEFREQHSKTFEGKLWKGETVYYEVVGFTHTGAPIMASCDNKKLNDKEFIKQYGKETVFSYGCAPSGINYEAITATTEGRDNVGIIAVKAPQSDIYVYRMTMTNEDGQVVEYTPDFMRYRCEQMGVKTVPVLWSGRIPEDEWEEWCYDLEGVWGEYLRRREGTPGEWIKNKAEEFYDGADPIGKTHVREGVVVRIVNRPKFTAYKHKNHTFKMLSGIIVEQAENSGATDTMDADILSEM